MFPRLFENSREPSRRGAAAALGAGAAMLFAPAGVSPARAAATGDLTFAPPVSGQVQSRVLTFADPIERFKAEFRLLRDLADEADVLMWYFFTVFVVAEGHKVQPLARFEGIEFSAQRRIDTYVYRLHGHNLSFPRDLHTNAFIDTIVNPVTGKTIKIPPTVLTEDPGMLYSPAGKRPLDRKSDEFTPSFEQFRIEDELVKCEQIRVPPDTWPTPFIETSHNWTSRAAFEDASIARLPMGTSGGYISPFPGWLEMGEIKGHTFATWSGKKLDGPHQLPAEYVAKAQIAHAHLLKVDMSKFDKPI